MKNAYRTQRQSTYQHHSYPVSKRTQTLRFTVKRMINPIVCAPQAIFPANDQVSHTSHALSPTWLRLKLATIICLLAMMASQCDEWTEMKEARNMSSPRNLFLLPPSLLLLFLVSQPLARSYSRTVRIAIWIAALSHTASRRLAPLLDR